MHGKYQIHSHFFPDLPYRYHVHDRVSGDEEEVKLNMKNRLNHFRERGKIGYILAWALGIPIPILLLVYFLRGCN